jgi:hypothetical protein
VATEGLQYDINIRRKLFYDIPVHLQAILSRI